MQFRLRASKLLDRPELEWVFPLPVLRFGEVWLPPTHLRTSLWKNLQALITPLTKRHTIFEAFSVLLFSPIESFLKWKSLPRLNANLPLCLWLLFLSFHFLGTDNFGS